MNSNIYEQVMDAIRRNESVSIRTEFTGEEGDLETDLVRSVTPVETITDSKGRHIAKVGYQSEAGKTTVSEPVFPQERLIIFGGGHVSLQVYEMAVKCGFRVTICDDREEFANDDRFPLAQEVLCAPFETCFEKLKLTPYDYVVIVTRGHMHDRNCLEAVLSGNEPKYTGMIGSRRKVKALLALMEEKGYSKERVDRVCSPIGLNIGAVTPEEIGVSILAELIAYKRLPEHTISIPCNESDLPIEMIEFLAADNAPKAVATIIRTDGSTPRGAGAKMAVYPDGKIVGTIGGGGAEGAVMREAAAIIGTGRYKVCTFDMGGKVAEDEGMACGGVMKVLVEDAC